MMSFEAFISSPGGYAAACRNSCGDQRQCVLGVNAAMPTHAWGVAGGCFWSSQVACCAHRVLAGIRQLMWTARSWLARAHHMNKDEQGCNA
jgi:hypothetical protein